MQDLQNPKKAVSLYVISGQSIAKKLTFVFVYLFVSPFAEWRNCHGQMDLLRAAVMEKVL